MALLTTQRCVLPAEEFRKARMLITSDSERIRRVTLLTCGAELTSMRIGVTRCALCVQPAEVARSLMTCVARQGTMFPFERKSSLCLVIECRALESQFIVACRTILLERSSVRILMARSAWLETQTHNRCWPHMTPRTWHGLMAPGEWCSRPCVIE